MKTIFFALLLLSARAKAQEFLGSDKSRINVIMVKRNGSLDSRLTRDSQNDILFNQSTSILLYKFPFINGKSDQIRQILFFFTKRDKCNEYVIFYAGDEMLKTLLNKFNTDKALMRDGNQNWRCVNKGFGLKITTVKQTDSNKILVTKLAVYNIKR